MKRLLTRLLWLFPEPFRDQFGSGMVEQVERDYDEARRRGRPAALRFALVAGWDLVTSGIAERWFPTWPGSRGPAEGHGMLSEWTADLRHAARALRRTPAFTAMTVGTLALAIGATAGMFDVVNTVLLDPMPYPRPDRLVFIAASSPGSDLPPEFGVGAEFYVQYQDQSRLLEGVAAYNAFTNTLRTPDRVERVWMSSPTNSLYATLGARPALGRLPVTEDGSDVVVISDRLWRTWFGADPGVLGHSYEIAGRSRQVIGVMGPEFAFPTEQVQLWIAGDIRPEGIQPGRFGIPLVGRLRPGATIEGVTDELNALARRLPERFGGSPRYARIIEQHRAVVRPLMSQLLGTASRSLWILLGAVSIVLVIACANVANLFMVRAEGRHRDLAVRRAIGASRGQLMRLQFAEALLVASLAGALAVLLAQLTLPVFLRAAPPGIPRLASVGVDLATMLFTAGAAVLSALACGLVPALRASAPDLKRLREGGRGSTGARHWGRDGLVVGQTALALVLLIGSGLLVRSFAALRAVDPGYDTADLFTFQFAPEQERLHDGPTWARFHLEFMDRLRALPGVTQVGIVENVPLNEGTASDRFRSDAMGDDPDAGALLTFTFAAGDYFSAMGIDVRRGRVFETADHTTTPGHVVISRSVAETLWPGQDPIGRRLQRRGRTTWETVVGVVDDVMQYGFRDTPQALVYYPMAGREPRDWWLSSPAYVIKTPRAEVIAPEVRALIHEVAPEAPMYRVYTMAGLAADSMVQLSFTTLTLGVVSSLALLLGALGLYGVLSYLVAERTREIGVRMALGASAVQVRRMVVAEGAKVVGLGIVIGVATALATTRALGGLLYGVAALDAATFVAMTVSMIVIGLLASYLPARRASNVDPMESLRSD